MGTRLWARDSGHEILGYEIFEHNILGHKILEHEILGHKILEHEILGHKILEHEILGHKILGTRLWDTISCCRYFSDFGVRCFGLGRRLTHL